MRTTRLVITLAVLMAYASVAVVAARPTTVNPEPPEFKENVPKHFGDWTELPDQGVRVVDPVVQRIYLETLTRT